jgi:hypothetical protein
LEEEEQDLREFEPEYYWENSRENAEQRDPPEDSGPDEGTNIKPKSHHPFFPDTTEVIRTLGGFFDSPREPLTAVAVGVDGIPIKLSNREEDRQVRKPNKTQNHPERDEQPLDATVQTSLVVQQKKKSTKKIIDMAISSKKNSPMLSESALANRQLSQQDKGVLTHSSQRHSHALETKRTQNLRSIDESPSECDDSKAKPSVSAAIVRRSTGRPVSEWFKPRKKIIPVVTGKSSESSNHANYSATPENSRQVGSDAHLRDHTESQTQIEKKDDPFNQLCHDIWSSGTELLSTTSAVLDSIGMEAMRSLQNIVSATVVPEPTKAITDGQEKNSPEERTHSDACEKVEHPCIIRNFENEKKEINTSMQTANHVFKLTYIAPQHKGQQEFPRNTEKQSKDKACRKRNTLPAMAKIVGQNSPRRTTPVDGQKYWV